MLLNFFTRFFHKRCPFCSQEVHQEAGTAVHRFGRWYRPELHADRYELDPYKAVRAVHCHHVGCDGAHVP
jgi:hypothetical protein